MVKTRTIRLSDKTWERLRIRVIKEKATMDILINKMLDDLEQEK